MKDSDYQDWVVEVKTFFSEKMFIEVDSPETNLVEAGILDSMVIVELLANLEERFGIVVPMAELDIRDFSSVATIARLLCSWHLKRSSYPEPTHSHPSE